MILVDVSEVKAFKECRRKWSLNSRNKWHIIPRVQKNVFNFGTQMHEMLHALYLGGDMQRALDVALSHLYEEPEQKVMTAIALGYSSGPLLEDLDRFEVKDIEYRFHIKMPGLDGVELTGSIDMIVVEKDTNVVYGFEHKSCKAFRPESYSLIDEQPRLYYYALQSLVKEMNKRLPDGEGKQLYTLGGIYLNEIKKVQRKFEYKRTLCKYTDKDLAAFMASFVGCCRKIHLDSSIPSNLPAPEPSMMKCQMCEFSSVCDHYGYSSPDSLEDFLGEFGEEFQIREFDHLEEKVHRDTPSDIV